MADRKLNWREIITVSLQVKKGPRTCEGVSWDLFLNCAVTRHAGPASERLRDEKDELSLNLLCGENTQSESVTVGCLLRHGGTGQKPACHGCSWSWSELELE